jgi:small-conductance mechanosensitive channel
LTFQFSVWGQKDRFLELRNSMYEQIKRAFDEQGIEIPFPHRSLYAGSATDPLPVRCPCGW